MIFELTSVIFRSLTFGFDIVQRIFDAIGFPWVAAVCMMVLVSVVLRLFTSRFIGTAIRVEINRHNTAKAAETARQASIRAKEEAKLRETLRIQSGRSVD